MALGPFLDGIRRVAACDLPMALGAFLDGIRRVAAAPLLLLFMCSLAIAAALAMGSLAGGAGTAGVESVRTTGSGTLVGVTHAFGPDASGLAVVAAFSSLAEGQPRAGAVALALAGMVFWTFLAGGVLDRLARQRWMGSSGFLAACRHHVWPLTRLAVLAGALYWLVLGVLQSSFVGDPPGAFTQGWGGTAWADAVWLALHGLVGAGRAAIGLVVDYARVRAVVEDRRSAIGALLAALRFAARRPAAVAVLWLLNAALLALILVGCSLLAPAVMGFGPLGPFLVAQMYTAAHLVATLVAWASQAAYFQGQLAHATYVARARVADSAGPARPTGAP